MVVNPMFDIKYGKATQSNRQNILIIDRKHIYCKVEFYKIEKKSTLRRVLFVCKNLICNIEYEIRLKDKNILLKNKIVFRI